MLDLLTLPKVRVQLSQGVPMLLCGTDSGVPFHLVPVLLATVHLGHDAEYGLPLLAVAADAEATTRTSTEDGAWLLLVHGGEAVAQLTLHQLGRAGAIRRDFMKEFN